jgi:hypothetical protein
MLYFMDSGELWLYRKLCLVHCCELTFQLLDLKLSSIGVNTVVVYLTSYVMFQNVVIVTTLKYKGMIEECPWSGDQFSAM